MDAAQIVKTTQEQAAAGWISLLNQLRLEALVAKLSAQDVNLEKAMAELQQMKMNLAQLIESGRGGEKGLHGFLAEAAEAGIENARRLIEGLAPLCTWINDNGPADIMRGNTPIQQKFVNSHFSIGNNAKGITEHNHTYPMFVKNGGKYQVPKDFYEAIMKLWAMPAREGLNLPKGSSDGMTPANWKAVHEFFENSGVTPDDLEPSLFNYKDVMRGKIFDTIGKEEKNIKNTDQRRRNEAYEASKPTLKQGAQASAVSAAMEGGVSFCLGVAKKRKDGKRLSDFNSSDWKDIGIETAKGTAAGGIRGAAVYGMTNFTATPASVASALVTAAFGVVGQANQLRQGFITQEDFIINSEVVCLDVSVSAVSALMGQIAIPVPILGPMVGNAAGMFFYGIAKDFLSEQEQALAASYLDSVEQLNRKLDERYRRLIEYLQAEFAKYSSILALAFDRDVNIAFDGSVALADYVGVSPEKVLHNKQDIDNYFMN